MATTPLLIASNPDEDNTLRRRLFRAISLPQIASTPDGNDPLQQNISKATTPSSPSDATNWDDIDPVTGLSKEYMTAMEIIDSCDYAELRRFNAPLLANQTLSIGQQIEIYYNGGESEKHRRKREEKVMAKRKSVVEKIGAMMAFWRGPKSRKAARDE